MDTQNFINQVATGDASGAKEALNDLLSSRAFDMLDAEVEKYSSLLNRR